MDKIALPRIQAILHDRAERLRADLDEAQAMKAEADAAGVAYENSLSDAQAKARDIAQRPATSWPPRPRPSARRSRPS